MTKYFFINQATGDSVYGLWLPSSTGRTIKNYKLTVPNGANVYLTEPGTYAEGITKKMPVTDGSITLDISETPVFVSITSSDKQIVNGKGKYIKPQMLCLSADFSTECCDLSAEPKEAGLKPFYRMFDEPDSMPEYIYGDTANLKLPETNIGASDVTCYVKLDKPYVLDGFGVYDTYGTGNIAVYDANTDTLLWPSDLGSYMSRSITMTDDSAPTDFLKIVKGGGEMNELALFGYEAPVSAVKPGDLNQDGVVDKKDVVCLTEWLLTKTDKLPNWKAGDMNDDGQLDVRDLSLLRKKRNA